MEYISYIAASGGATPEHITEIAANIEITILRSRVEAISIQYFQSSYEIEINPGTPDGLNLHPKSSKGSDKDEDRIKTFPIKL